MPAYEIRYRDSENRPTHCFAAECDCDTKAKVVAHAMKAPADRGLEVWRAGVLIYQRPAYVRPEAISPPRAMAAPV